MSTDGNLHGRGWPLPSAGAAWLATLAFGCGGAVSAEGPPSNAQSSGPPIAAFAEPASGTAQVCVLRPHLLAAERTFVIHDNGKMVGATRGATYFCYLAGPGLHHVTSAGDEVDRAQVYATAGTRYYLYQETSRTPGHVHASVMEWVDEGAARKIIAACDERVKVSVPGIEDHSGTMPFVQGKPR